MAEKKIEIRTVSESDAEFLLEIYAPYVKNTAVSFEMQVPSLETFKERIRKTISLGYPYFVVLVDDKIAGYAFASPFNERKAYEISAELSIYIHADFHGLGIGRLLYAKLEESLKKKGIVKVYALIAATPRNPDKYLTQASLLFHTKLGFSVVARFSACAKKFDNFYDAVYMEKTLQTIPRQSQNPEVMDVYDKHQIPTGLTCCRGKWEKGRLRSIVHVCVFNSKGELLIQHRVQDKESWPGLWDISIGGHIDAGEYSQQGAQRELKEELGIEEDFSDSRPALTLSFSGGYDNFYIIKKDLNTDELILQKEEVQEAMWASEEKILELIKNGSFIPYKTSLIKLLFNMNEENGAHTKRNF